MSVFVHIGQCGNQVGGAYWRLAHDEYGPPIARAETATRKRSASARQRGEAPRPSAWQQQQFFHSCASSTAVNPRVQPKARCIVVDSEPKVVQSIWTQDGSSSAGVLPAHVHAEHAGRGNNWAMGYNFQQYHRNVLPSNTSVVNVYENEDKRELIELVMDSLQKEIEGVDCYQGVVLTHSMGGGTGAGLGCRVMECIRDTYAKSYLVTLSIAPSFQCGDTPLQNYNAAFTFSHLQQYADCVIFKDNDDLLRTAGYWNAAQTSPSTPPSSKPRISLAELNQITAADLAGLLFPVVPVRSKASSAVARPFDFGAFIQEACPMPSIKFVDLRTGILQDRILSKTANSGARNPIPHALKMSTVWPAIGDQDESDSMQTKLTRQTLQAFRRPSSSSHVTIASWAIIRGVQNSIDSGLVTARKLAAAVDTSFPRVGWNTGSLCAQYSSELPFASQGGKLSVTVCVNTGHVVPSVHHVLQRAQAQFRANAYTHWYKQHGLEDEAFHTAFENCNQLICEYEDALR